MAAFPDETYQLIPQINGGAANLQAFFHGEFVPIVAPHDRINARLFIKVATLSWSNEGGKIYRLFSGTHCCDTRRPNDTLQQYFDSVTNQQLYLELTGTPFLRIGNEPVDLEEEEGEVINDAKTVHYQTMACRKNRQILQRIDAAEGRITAAEGRLTAAEGRISALEQRMTALEARVAQLEARPDPTTFRGPYCVGNGWKIQQEGPCFVIRDVATGGDHRYAGAPGKGNGPWW